MELNSIKTQFPIFNNYSKNNFLYLDSASTTLKHESVISKLNQYNSEYSANIHRSVYPIAEKATNEFEKSRVKVANFINSKSEEIIFTKNTTESINLVAYSWGLSNLKKDDIILISKMEHHSNIIPWQFVAKKTGCQLKYIPLLEDGNLDIDSFESLLSEKVKLVSLIHQSNVTGSINPIQEIVKKAHSNNALVLIDAAQSISHIQIDINKIDCDFLVFSGHKMFGSTGVGILYGKYELLDRMDPFLYGGQMINKVNEQNSTWNVLPLKFEAGTPNIAEVISLGASIDFIQSIGFNKINEHLSSITNAYLEILNKCRGITIYGHRKNRGPVISFNIENIHPQDLAQFLNEDNICIRVGHHCAQPLLETLNETSTARASFYIYNDFSDIDKLVDSIKSTISYF